MKKLDVRTKMMKLMSFDHKEYIPVPGDDVVLHSKNRRPVVVDPRNLHNNIIDKLNHFQINHDLCPNYQVFNYYISNTLFSCFFS
jgi:hypothetical protein